MSDSHAYRKGPVINTMTDADVESEDDEDEDSSSRSNSYAPPTRLTQRQAALAGMVETPEHVVLGKCHENSIQTGR